ncbi:MAG TPA: DUF459 domain-containing protein [Candidatus Binatia bacterium]|nr:DUF459 domain-containing protein [Candidatus Binatia bacterium]
MSVRARERRGARATRVGPLAGMLALLMPVLAGCAGAAASPDGGSPAAEPGSPVATSSPAARPVASPSSTASTLPVASPGALSSGPSGGSSTPPFPALSPPSEVHPLTILEIGDSLGEDLGWGLTAVLGADPAVRLVEDAVGYTGLARPDYYDWPAHLEQDLAATHPAVVVVMLGANDSQDCNVSGHYIAFGSAAWLNVYSQRVASVIQEATAAGARVLWMGMPVMAEAWRSQAMTTLNDIYSDQAAAHPGVLYISSWSLLTDAGGDYAQELPDASGRMVEVRTPDGVHITTDGAILLTRAAVAAMDEDWGAAI